ncbi:uncharacterized protein LOC126980114 [Leptidea sinapis]|uniref:uncharacterized protein LOC126980114 n=1 Tax=Leptidea sinapis TaxID=189913 RepID=UPI0021C3A90A|nr:uncharacterized protein LOC126980114 [Leptidea sinapis]
MEEPIEPSKDDCCNNGCNPCIFDVYDMQMKLLRKSKEKAILFRDDLYSFKSYWSFNYYIYLNI